jgi:hypothetical protein
MDIIIRHAISVAVRFNLPYDASVRAFHFMVSALTRPQIVSMHEIRENVKVRVYARPTVILFAACFLPLLMCELTLVLLSLTMAIRDLYL